MKKLLISSFDLEVGGVERSLINLLENFDYSQYEVDLMLYRHKGDFMKLLSKKVNLLPEIPVYSTFRKSIKETFKDGHYNIGYSRILSKINSDIKGRLKGIVEPGYYQMQLMWRYTLPFLPVIEKEYDLAISYLWPHYFVAKKVKAKKKIAWIHTDFSTVETDVNMDLKMWNHFNLIIAVSQACKDAFLKKYSELQDRVIVIENIASPDFVRKMADEKVDNLLMKDKRFKVITVARLSHAKGIDNAVKALRILKNRGYDDIAWYVVGYGGDEKVLQELIAKNDLKGRFILMGKKINPYPFMKAADLYVQPSRYEGKAVTVGEAQILAKPIMITNYPTAKSQVQNGIDGYICEQTITGISEGVENLYKHPDLREVLSKNCIEKDYANFKQLNKLYTVLKEIK
ncbi:glycosyl transferase [Virgibacillus phasianinus]|uniref:Glycosyl transferase n=1 Tax=Virgibacillus phasianinus TaxID=2017483 RepID=A0A220U6E2_9BACI|nr:glycosyltransferase [Virgibacillus phasianinus]ASK63718.1 glycosyl transferase [Virgibacillus phasianinus]